MSSGQRRASYPFNDTQIKNGRIVRLRKDGTVKADLGPWPKEKDSKDSKK
jgi:hypothetical protein